MPKQIWVALNALKLTKGNASVRDLSFGRKPGLAPLNLEAEEKSLKNECWHGAVRTPTYGQKQSLIAFPQATALIN